MATIVINAITHRSVCTDQLREQDLIVYDNVIDGFLAGLAEAANSECFGFEVDSNGIGITSYYVIDEADPDDFDAAHQFMQSPRAYFWAAYFWAAKS